MNKNAPFSSRQIEHPETPLVSVIIAAHNAERFIGQSIESILAQTYANFELLVVNDCSDDNTVSVVRQFADPRLHLIDNARNLGVVGARNVACAKARGRYIAILDSDDVSHPTRFAKQVQVLEQDPDLVLVGTEIRILQDGRLGRDRYDDPKSPELLDWMLQISNPLAFSSTMARASAIVALGEFLREDRKYAEDFDLYHRLAKLGSIACLPEPLTIYRRHAANASRLHEQRMFEVTADILADSFAEYVPQQANEAAAQISRHICGTKAFPDLATLRRTTEFLGALLRAYIARKQPASAVQRQIIAYAQRRLWEPTRASIRTGTVALVPAYATFRDFCRGTNGAPRHMRRAARAGLASLLPGWASHAIREHRPKLDAVRNDTERPVVRSHPSHPVRASSAPYVPSDFDLDRPPTLYVVVDTEAEFNWDGPFSKDHTQVSSMADIGRGQEVFDRYGLRPIYLIDYPVASQAPGFGPLKALLDRGVCAVGAHLQPWTTPPFEESVDGWNSYAGNLSPELEERKLVSLLNAIRSNLGVDPRFYKAGRYGLGPHTAPMLARHGIKVDFSVMPGTSFADKGGPDFRRFEPRPYVPEGTELLTLPMTRGQTGALSFMGPEFERFVASRASMALRLPALMRQSELLNRATVTPEGTPAQEQIALLLHLLRRGRRSFVMTFHSPSLSPGHTPYSRTAADVTEFLGRIDAVLHAMFGEVGLRPGDPADLLPPALRGDATPPGQAWSRRMNRPAPPGPTGFIGGSPVSVGDNSAPPCFL